MKRIKPRDEQLDGDSISEITDLSMEDIMTTSKQLLTEKEQQKLEKYNEQFRKNIRKHVQKHNCFAQNSKEKKEREVEEHFLVTMEMRCKSQPPDVSDKELSAH